jgi:hypothetical protein
MKANNWKEHLKHARECGLINMALVLIWVFYISPNGLVWGKNYGVFAKHALSTAHARVESAAWCMDLFRWARTD